MGPIGGILDKVVAAREADADIMLVPRDNFDEVRDVDTGDAHADLGVVARRGHRSPLPIGTRDLS